VLSASQIRTIPRLLAVASQVPSAQIATACTPPSWPAEVARGYRPRPRSGPRPSRRQSDLVLSTVSVSDTAPEAFASDAGGLAMDGIS
jgi:hypothetical protein